ncbi:MAG: glutamine--tRNA ligase/YqeY domain fusion protein [Acidobacteriota bacterium]
MSEETTHAPDEPSDTLRDDSARDDFIRDKVRADLASSRVEHVVTRFPPEPNGYLHIGHAKAIVLSFEVAREFGGVCRLRFDDTNPETEDIEYVEAIERDVRWLGYTWDGPTRFASDYFEQLAEWGEKLIRDGKAYVDRSSEDEIRAGRGSITEPGTPSPDRDLSVDDNLELFRQMRAGEMPDGAAVLRAKIDMAAANMLMRDPLLFRIRHAHHYRRGDAWCIYPMYDYAHCLEDAIEGVTHSFCTLEFENNREIYDWLIEAVEIEPPRPEQTEFARLSLGFTVMSKRKLLQLVTDQHVAGWDDPRMPTISGLRRRGVTPEAIRRFAEDVGVAKRNNVIDIARFEHAIRDDLNHRAPRRLAVLDPIEIELENWPGDHVEQLEADDWPRDVPKDGTRAVPFGRRLLVEREDFAEDPPEGWHRLALGREVRLRYAYVVECTEVVRDTAGRVTTLRCRVDLKSRGGKTADGRSVPGTIHWVSADHSVPLEARLYDRLFRVEQPDATGGDFLQHLNPESLVVHTDARAEPSLAGAAPGTRVQLERLGYFVVDQDSAGDPLVMNRTVTLRDTWAKVAQTADAREAAARAQRRAEEKKAYKEAQRRQSEAGDDGVTLSADEERIAARYRDALGLAEHDATLLARHAERAEFFDAAHGICSDAHAVARWAINELRGAAGDRPLSELPFEGAALGRLVALVEDGAITAAAGKEVLAAMVAGEGTPEGIVDARNLRRIDDAGALEPTIDAVLAANAGQVAAYRGGKTALFGFFIGQVMQQTGGTADPQMVRRLLTERLDAD